MMRRGLLLALPLVAVGCSSLLLSSSARASDGVLEISQACALAGGCFPGDGVGFPVEVASSASYRLTSNLVVPDENTTGILVSASAVTIDLNGFEIVRSGCEGANVNCTPATGAGSGVAATAGAQATAVRNGTISGMGNAGVALFEQAEVLALRVRWNAGSGISVGSGSNVIDNTVRENGGTGLALATGTRYAGNVVQGNGATVSDGVDTGTNVCNGVLGCP
jgi:hypothetical protein